MISSKYRPEIDGLRALAILPVVFFHMGFTWISGGYLGVDVFFVISGFLITSILIDEHDRGVFGYTTFWKHRIRRIFPALAVMLILSSLWGTLILSGNDTQILGGLGLAALVGVANICLWRIANDYWGDSAANLEFLHTWSLSVETQFYILFPCFLACLFRFARAWLLEGILLVAALSFALYVNGANQHTAATFYLLPTRAWELASGCLLAVAQWKYGWRPRGNSILSGLGLAAIIGSYLFLSGENAFPGSLIFVVVGCVLVIAYTTHHNNIVHTLLTARPLVAVGKVSYSLYLWHWPVIVMARNHFNMGGAKISNWLLFVAMAGMSVASYYGVEKPTRHLVKISRIATVGFTVSLAFSCFLILHRSLLDMSMYSPIVWRGHEYDATRIQNVHSRMSSEFPSSARPVGMDTTDEKLFANKGVFKGYGTGGVDIVVLGDSHGLMWAEVLEEIAKELKLNICFFAANATSPFIKLPLKEEPNTKFRNSQEKLLFDKARTESIKTWKPRIVLLLTRWSMVPNTEVAKDLMSLLMETPAQVLTIEQPPELFFGDKKTPRQLAAMKMIPKEHTNQFVRSGNKVNYELGKQIIAELAQKYQFFHTIKSADLFTQDSTMVWVLEGDQLLYIDDNHLSQAGALKAKSRIKASIEALCAVSH
jgi:peptidoglycan/LPS O-acetylase OafA/YrhL